MRVLVCGLLIAVASGGFAPGDELARSGFVDRVYKDAAGEHKYVVYVPHGQPPQGGWPVILFLHGAGERGADGRRQVSVGLGPAVQRRFETFPAVVVFPQAENFDRPILRTWSPQADDGRRALAILAEVEQTYPIDPSRRILTGWSMGAFGAWALAAADPEHWSAVVTVAGGGRPDLAPRLTGLPIWAFHGAADRIVPLSTTREMVEAVRRAGGSVLYSEVADDGHDVWKRVYDSDVVLNWMLNPDTSRSELEAIDLPPQRFEAADVPFVPVMVIEQAMTVRLGQDAIDIIATGLPATLQPDDLSGTLEDVTEELELDGRAFDVHFGELSYTAELERALIRARGADRVQAEIGLRNVRLHVGRIAVSDGEVGFTAGPAEVVVGHRQPVWLRIEARPAITSQRLDLKLLRSSFEIPDYNWFVREPRGIRLQGVWLTEEEVKTAVVGGIYVRRETIEEQVLSAVPTLLERFGEAADLTPLEQMVAALWPLPVYRPEVRVIPESISTDSAGVSMTLSVAVAAIDASIPDQPERLRASAPTAHAIARTSDLRVGIAVDVLDHISSLLAGSEAGRVFTTDIPGRPFEELTDPAALADILPQTALLSSAQAVETSFALEAPLQLRPVFADARSASRAGVRIQIDAPRLAMQISAVGADLSQGRASAGPPQARHPSQIAVSTEGARKLSGGPSPSGDVIEPLFRGDIALSQPVSLEPVRLEDGRMGLQVTWEREAEITIPADPSANAAAQETAELFRRGWKRWTEAQAEQIAPLPEVALGSASMILTDLSWEQTRLSVRFGPAATRLVNSTSAAIEFQVRGPYSRWSRTYTLPAGESLSFSSGTKIRIRPENHWEFDAVAMPAGSHWECRRAEHGSRREWVRTDSPRPAGGHPRDHRSAVPSTVR